MTMYFLSSTNPASTAVQDMCSCVLGGVYLGGGVALGGGLEENDRIFWLLAFKIRLTHAGVSNNIRVCVSGLKLDLPPLIALT